MAHNSCRVMLGAFVAAVAVNASAGIPMESVDVVQALSASLSACRANAKCSYSLDAELAELGEAERQAQATRYERERSIALAEARAWRAKRAQAGAFTSRQVGASAPASQH